jgi:peptidoglycan hydrolase-like protein with peptidoglycan-binding domain/phosphodiesterase/alkaline phosphatase D-like protein
VGNVAYSNDNTFTTGALPVVNVTPTLRTTPPVISGIATSSVGENTATISWATDEAAVSTMSYGTSLSYGSVAPLSASALLDHATVLTGLAASTTYYYCIHATDFWGNAASACGQSFATPAAPLPPDTTPPVISGVAQESVASYDATIAWSTNELATSSIRYGTSTNLGSVLPLDASAGLVHSGTIAGLSAATTYYYCIDATDLAGNTASSCGNSFTTAAAPIVPDTTAPVISLITTASFATSTAIVTWTTNELANAQIEYGTSTSYGSVSPLASGYALTHSESLSGLLSGMTYHYRVISADAAGNLATSTDQTFITESVQVIVPPDATPPIISAVDAASISNITATITWTTNELATSTLTYGTTTNYGLEATLSASALLAHEAALTGLIPQTTYYYCISATDLAGNTASSCGHSFTTGATPDTIPPVISNITQASLTSYDATIAWSTNELATSSIRYGTSANSLSLTLPVSGSAALVHEATIADLAANTTYYYCIDATDLAGNTASSCGHSFTTAAAPIAPDITPPTLAAIVVASLATSTATITWTTSEVANGQVEYGMTASYGSASVIESNLGLTHSADLAALEPDTTYHYQVKSVDVAGNIATSTDYTFTTASLPQIVVPPDTTPPIISGVAQASVSSYDTTITWNTNELATSSIRYGTSTNYESVLAISTSAGLIHFGTIADLAANTTYDYCIDATDLTGNTASSCGHSFTTAAAPLVPDTTPPVLSLIVAAPVATSTATVTFTTSELANAQVEYGTSTSYGSNSSLDTSLALTHSVSLSDLTASTTYHYAVISADAAGNLATSTDQAFTTGALPQVVPVVVETPPAPTSTPASILNVSSTVVFAAIETQSVGTSTVTIIYTTDIPSDSQVNYGVSSQLGSSTVVDSTPTTMHSVVITDLSPNTNYVFNVASAPVGVSTATVSGNHEFNTLATPIFTTTPANVSGVQATAVTTSTATIAWTTDKPADSQVQYGITTAYGQSASDASLQTSHDIALSSLAPSTTYHYRVRSMDADGNVTFSDDNTFTTAAVQVVVPSVPETPNSTANITVIAAPDALGSLSVSGSDRTSATLAWSVSSSSVDAASEYDIRYSTAPITQNNFASATEAQQTPVLYTDLAPNGTARTYVIAGLSSSTMYYFAIASKYQASDWSLISNLVSAMTLGGQLPETPSSTVSVATTTENNTGGGGGSIAASYANAGGSAGAVSGGAIGTPTLGSAAGSDGQVILNWNDPNQTSFVRTIIVKKAGGYPTSPSDGQVIYDGNSETFTDTNVMNGTTYYYALYSYDRAMNYSAPIHVALAPQGGATQITLNGTPTITQPIQYHFTNVLAPGSTDIQEVSHLQDILTKAGVYPNNLVTGYFGNITQNALKQYQALHGIAQTGVTDAKTQILLNAASLSDQTMNVPQEIAIFETDLRRGMTAEDVGELQQFLIYEGDYPEAQISGYFGPLTQNAVIAFQQKYDIVPAIGYVGPITRHTIQTISGF